MNKMNAIRSECILGGWKNACLSQLVNRKSHDHQVFELVFTKILLQKVVSS